MKIEFETVYPDEGSSFRLLHNNLLAENYCWSYHYHPEYEIVCVPRGNGTRHVGNRFGSYTDGDLVFMGPNLPHAGFGLNAHGIHEEYVIQIKEDVLHQSVLSRPEMQVIKGLLERSRYGIHFNTNLKDWFAQQMLNLKRMDNFNRFLELIKILYEMARCDQFELLNKQSGLTPVMNRSMERLQEIFSYVEANFQEEITIQKAASLAHLSVPSFCNYFKKTMNTTFTNFVNRYRIQHACSLLVQNKSIAEACFMCGFNNVTYFNKIFKEMLGKTPSAFRKDKIAA